MRKKSKRMIQDHCSLISFIVIAFCILSPICNGEELKEKLQPVDISENVKPSETETHPQEGLVTFSTETDTKEENVSNNQREIEDQVMIESEHIEIEPKHNDKDDFSMDPIFNEIIEPSLRITSGNGDFEHGEGNSSSTYLKSKQPYLYNAFEFEDWERGKRGALHLAGIILCATGCNPLSSRGYGCFCGVMGAGEPVDGIDMCCKMHDWCYTTTTCHGLEWDLPYFVPFKWKCNGGSPYCIPGKTKKTNRNSCSHQLCECDREFAMCLHKHLPCPRSKAGCKNKKRKWQNLLMGLTSGHGMHHPHKSGATYFPNKPSKHYQHHTHQHREKPRTLNNHFNPFKIFG
jgi:secretory phospholipase A2